MFSKLFKSHKKDEPLKPFQGDLEGLWYLEGKAYDLTKFVKMHPGGSDVLLELKGKDGTAAFRDAHGNNPTSTPRKKLGRMEVKGISAEVLSSKFSGDRDQCPP
ncbi:hypothetical protein NSK_005759 [Nannochloropsis salina CCMP1776]|uniref:Cytochrome b5 heme-binding domain-containing protein n=1 Tax=Nannochloropsis salina CCMP1776 TaxID=1027361 RepID=A0A4D9CWI3_9STRA|nr:hypothetical protein NSK_005759 [Nannochloropsis salina CCMP1776]|eukprot:TFJ82934.1 hypothetical protein NSK_005759 [Nannochloropsis salina CCMP1776]